MNDESDQSAPTVPRQGTSACIEDPHRQGIRLAVHDEIFGRHYSLWCPRLRTKRQRAASRYAQSSMARTAQVEKGRPPTDHGSPQYNHVKEDAMERFRIGDILHLQSQVVFVTG